MRLMPSWVRQRVRMLLLWLLALLDTDETSTGTSASPLALTSVGSAHQCARCGRLLPPEAIRTHDGRWTCREHK